MFSWCVHFVHNTNLFIKSKYVYIIIQSRTFWYFVRQLSERGRIMFFHFIIYLYQYLYKVFHVMVGLTVYWYTLYSENDCQYTCRSLSFIFYVKKIYISIYLYFFYCKSNLWKIKIFKETLNFTCLRYIHLWSRILDLHENISLTASVNQICSTNVQYCIKGSRW